MTHCWQTPFSWRIDDPEPEVPCANLGTWFLYKTPPIPCIHPRNFLWDLDAVMPISTCYHILLLLLPCSFTSLWNSYLSSFCISPSPGQSQILYLLPIRSVFFLSLLFYEDICNFFFSTSLYKSSVFLPSCSFFLCSVSARFCCYYHRFLWTCSLSSWRLVSQILACHLLESWFQLFLTASCLCASPTTSA